jgi:hypothetical protein
MKEAQHVPVQSPPDAYVGRRRSRLTICATEVGNSRRPRSSGNHRADDSPQSTGSPHRLPERLAFGFLGNEADFGIAGAFINLTVTQTVGAGFLTVRAFDGPLRPDRPVVTSNINWSSDGQTIANSSLVPLGYENLAELICTGGETHFIIDVQGYLSSLPAAP